MSYDEAQTERYLKTNGPPPDAFKPNVPDYALEGASKREKYLLEMTSVASRQNEWLIKETVGLKGAHRMIHSRLAEGDKRFEMLETQAAAFSVFRDKWLTGKKLAINIVLGLLTLVLLPALAMIAVEWIKHSLNW